MDVDTGAFVVRVLIAVVFIVVILRVLLKPVIRKRRRKQFDKKVVEFYRENEGY